MGTSTAKGMHENSGFDGASINIYFSLLFQIVVFAVDVPITKGYTCILHHGSVQAAASVKKLLGLLDKTTGEVAQNTKKPRLLTKGNNAVVEIATETPVCLDLYANSKELGRFMLRTGGKPIAAGMVADTWWCNQIDYCAVGWYRQRHVREHSSPWRVPVEKQQQHPNRLNTTLCYIFNCVFLRQKQKKNFCVTRKKISSISFISN